MQKPESIDAYIANFPSDVQEILNKIRNNIKAIAPEAEESISYGIPTFKMKGKVLVHYAAFKNHIGLYATPDGNKAFEKELKTYKTGKGSIQFPLSQAIPYELIDKMVQFKLQQTQNSK